ncbi:MAG TPA: aminopeptidase [Casimicrobiaceae bacterium]|nr:aminopeptidase [Casimicrobiaceae bacterium]
MAVRKWWRARVARADAREPTVARRVGRWCAGAAVIGGGAWLLSACAAVQTVDYYWQSAAGQWDLVSRARSIHDVIAETDDAGLKIRLTRIHAMREFASDKLGLPSNGSYTRYTDLGRPFVTWNVFATPELSLTPRSWCFPIAGCVNYRGFFREAEAKDEARRLKSDGEDVYIGGVPAYSTLGYFDDPILSSFVRWPETDVARLIFHELAHQLIYLPGDSVFNESYASTVEEVGLERWLVAQHNAELLSQVERTQRQRAMFKTLVRETRDRLASIYASREPAAEKRKEKAQAFAAMKTAYDEAKAKDPGLVGYERWFAQAPNNASLSAIALYTDRVPAFRAILKEEGDDLARFYDRVRELTRMPKAQRDRILDAYGRGEHAPPSLPAATRAAL